MKTFEFTDKGPRVENQDACYLKTDTNPIFAAVADGVGGNNGGATASKLAIETIISGLDKNLTLGESLLLAHKEILDLSSEKAELRGMATTLTTVTYENEILKGAHCGDSRAYILRGNGIKQLTKDHTEVAKLLAEGRISKEGAINYPRKNILESALGTHKELTYQEFTFNIEHGDRLLLATDGIYSELHKKDLVLLSKQEGDFIKFCENIISQVKELGPTDNYTLIGIEF